MAPWTKTVHTVNNWIEHRIL